MLPSARAATAAAAGTAASNARPTTVRGWRRRTAMLLPLLWISPALLASVVTVQGFVATPTTTTCPLVRSFPTTSAPRRAPLLGRFVASTASALRLFDPSLLADATTATATATLAASMDSLVASSSSFSTSFSAPSALLSFTDQGQNLAGIFFQASLLPYLLFVYFLSFRGNRLTETANFGFQFVLMFVLTTIPSGIITKSVYGTSLANVDWLHGGAETLLTIANVLIVLGLKDGMTRRNPPPVSRGRAVAFGAFGMFALACAAGTSLGFEAHSPFLFGLGDLGAAATAALPWATHNEPANALSIPTWAIHFSSVIEYVFAMGLVWQYSKVTSNPAWKGLTWGMLPLHASGFCACTYHFFYNPPSLQFLVTMQAALTLLGNLTCALAAYRIAASNGWTLEEVNPLPRSPTSPQGLVADGIAATPLQLLPSDAFGSTRALTAKLVGLTLLCSYLVKYGELGLDLPFTPNAATAVLMVLGVPAVTAYNYYSLSSKEEGGDKTSPLAFLGFGGRGGDGSGGAPALSMDDVKKYGVAGTVAYVLTELAFWVVAFPVAAYALYQSTGHWPDVVNDNADRAAVLAFIFAGANVARAFVPVRLGAALALAPWVDENILSKAGGGGGESPAAGDAPSE